MSNLSKILSIAFLFFYFPSMGQNSKNPIINFDALCELFELNYASFEEKKIDWSILCECHKKKINSKTSDVELFHLMTELLKPLNDAHVNLTANNIDSSFSASRDSKIRKELSSLPKGTRKSSVRKMTEHTLESNGFKSISSIGPKFRGEKLFEFTNNGNVGYVRFFRSFSTLPWMVGPSLNGQLNQIFDAFQDLDAIIVDIRFNIGGEDRFSQSIAGRFVEKETVGFYKQTRKDGTFGELKSKVITPKGDKAFLKDVILLTNDLTVSAADVLALMMSQFPNVTIIGDRSNGSFSDLYEQRLPNGWKITLSNQRYLSTENINYEGIGTPVDIQVHTTIENITLNQDSVLLKALTFIENRNVPNKQ